MRPSKNLILRNSKYSLKRRVPKRYWSVETRPIVWVSLHTDSLSIANEKAQAVWEEMVAGWEARLSGNDPEARHHFDAVQTLANARGFKYLPMDQVAELPIDELLTRIENIGSYRAQTKQSDAKALLGAIARPAYSVSETLTEYWRLSRDKTLQKSPDQIRRWRNPRIKAINNFISIVGDKPISEITRDDLIEFRDWWLARIEVQGLDPSTANKDFTHFNSVLKTVNELKKMGLDLPTSGLHLKEGKKKSRPQFSTEWIKTRLLADGALDGLEGQARAILLIMINTGARPSEIANLMPDHIRLDHQYPHIIVTTDNREDQRELKSKNSDRKIPLLGVSLRAIQSFPNGFPLYHDNPTLSDITNRYLTQNNLRETPQHTAYSLRHSFEERLRRAKIDDRIRAELFGHTYHRERYGEPTIEELTECAQAIAI